MKTEAPAESSLLDDPAKYLNHLLVERKLKNKSYSARAFARDLGLSQAFLSQILSRKRNLSLEQKVKLAARIGVPVELPAVSKKKFDILRYSLEHERILAHWYHFGILELTQVGALPHDPKYISKRLGVSEIEIRAALERLIEFGYLELSGKKLKRTGNAFLIDVAKSSQAVRNLHRSRLEAAIAELSEFQEDRTRNRLFQTLFLPSTRARVQNVRKMIDEFQDKLFQYLITDQPDEIFQFSLQIFSAEKDPKQK